MSDHTHKTKKERHTSSFLMYVKKKEDVCQIIRTCTVLWEGVRACEGVKASAHLCEGARACERAGECARVYACA